MGLSPSRRESNAWLRVVCKDITGDVLSVGSGDNLDRDGHSYREYFPSAKSFTSSETLESRRKVDLILDVRKMDLPDECYDCIFCCGVLEHIDELHSALNEMYRVLKKGGYLIVGFPFWQRIHKAPSDYWRFTEDGARHLLKDYEILEVKSIQASDPLTPNAYWIKAKK
jgi:SAM-dependent methyltransferase